MKSDELKNLRQQERHLTEWLCLEAKAKEIVPDVQKSLDTTRWEISALEGLTTVAGEIPSTAGLSYLIAQDWKLTQAALPLMPGYNQTVVSTASSATVSGAAAIYNLVSQLADVQDLEVIGFSNMQTKRYREIQAQQERPKQVRSLMQIFCGAETLLRFDMAVQAYLSSKSGVTTRMDAANAIRNALYGLKGDLFEKAKATPNDKNVTWEKMYQRLAKGVEEREVLASNDVIRSSLYGGLGTILKRNNDSATNLDDLWTQALDFIYTVLNLLKPI